MFNIILKILITTIIICGVTLIYDARVLTKKFFSFGDANEGAAGLKFLGVLFVFIGGISLFFLK